MNIAQKSKIFYKTFKGSYTQNYNFDVTGNITEKTSKENTLTGTKTGDNLNYSLSYNLDPNYAHRFINIGERYYKYDEVGNIIAEKDGDFNTDDEEYIAVEKVGDALYGTEDAWGYYKEETESESKKRQRYHREFSWDERNNLIKIKDNNIEVMFVYGKDGKRSNKYTKDTETLYFNNFWTYYIDGSTSLTGGKVSKHIFLGNTRLATAINSYSNVGTGYTGEEKEHIYYYHSDHLGSASLISDYNGNEYERIEYTPYGETWLDIKIEGAKEINPLSYRFSAKEIDDETGLYYYGARYLNPKNSMWMSADPALGEYVSSSDAGCGGIYNHINMNLYHYAGNNPIRYTDPDGREIKKVSSTYMTEIDPLVKINHTQNTVYNSGCVLTAYFRMAQALGYEGDLKKDECLCRRA